MVKQGRIISVFGTKGGVGKTLVSVNLAIDLARETGAPVSLVDLDMSLNGDLGLLLGMPESRAIIDLIPMLDSLDDTMLRGYLATHPSGVTVIPALHDQPDIELITPPVVRQFLALCSQTYEFTIVDCGSAVSPVTVAILDCSHTILLISRADFLSLHQTVKALSYLRLHHFPRERVEVVLNNVHPKIKKDDRTIVTTLRRDVFEMLPSDPDVVGTSIIRKEPFVVSAPRSAIARKIGELTLALLKKLQKASDIDFALEKVEDSGSSSPAAVQGITAGLDADTRKIKLGEREDLINKIKKKVHESLIDRLDLRKLDVETGTDPEKVRILREETLRVIVELIDEIGAAVVSREERRKIAKEVLDEALGLGPLEDLIRDEAVTEIMVNKYNRIYVERKGKIELTEYSFINNRQLLGVIERIVSPLGRRIDESTPFVDARLPDGSRVNAIIPPVSLQGPMITIRKFSKVPYTMENLIRFGSLTAEMAEFFDAAVKSRQNILISGGTGSGKTTMLNVLSACIPLTERIITIEDAAELKLTQDHVASLEARPPNIEGEGEVTIRDLVRNALRMRPDRIIVGECRGGETLDMLQAMNTGHDGSLTTVHANSPKDSLSRLETMVLFAGFEIPTTAIRQQISSALNLIAQTARFSTDGSRKVSHVFEVMGIRGQEMLLEPIFVYIQTGLTREGRVDGRYVPTGHVPGFIKEYIKRGNHFSLDVFQPKDTLEKRILDDYLSQQKVSD
jgi:pilus assembly protein CpaF